MVPTIKVNGYIDLIRDIFPEVYISCESEILRGLVKTDECEFYFSINKSGFLNNNIIGDSSSINKNINELHNLLREWSVKLRSHNNSCLVTGSFLDNIRSIFLHTIFECTSHEIAGKIESCSGNTRLSLNYDGSYAINEQNYGTPEEITNLKILLANWSDVIINEKIK